MIHHVAGANWLVQCSTSYQVEFYDKLRLSGDVRQALALPNSNDKLKFVGHFDINLV